MENAKAVLDNENATQAEVNKAWDDLLEAIWGLGINQGDKTLLNVLITKAEEMEKNADKYVETHWQELLDALKAAKEVSADGGALQAEVDEAANALHQAILLQRYKANKENLDKEEGSSEKPDEGEKPDSPATGDSNNGFLWFAVAFAGLMAAVLVITQRKKSMNHE